MEQLEATKGKSVVVPRIVNRYLILYYTKEEGWTGHARTFVTPESAIEDFLRYSRSYKKGIYGYPYFYKVVEVELEIPIIEEE